MPQVWPTTPPSAAQRAAFADAERRSFWLEDVAPGAGAAALTGTTSADLCIVGAGFTGLWAALYAKAVDPQRDVLLLEAETAGFGASGRNGGFLVSTLTHGIANGMARFAGELETLERLGTENLSGIRADLDTYAIDCDFELSGDLTAILEPYQDAWIAEEAALLRSHGHEVEVFADAAAMQAEVASPTYRGGIWTRDSGGIVHPGKLATGLRDAALRAGVRICEHTRAEAIQQRGAAIELLTPQGRVSARRVLLATSAFPPLLRAISHYVVPVYDYVLVTEPLSRSQRESLGWKRRQGISDGANRFHYYRLIGDERVLWGGYDAVYRHGSPVGPQLDSHEPTFATLSQHFFTTFPQLDGVRFSHAWGGAIDTCSRFSVFFGSAFEGRVAYAVGYTGLGVASSRFGARVALDLLDGRETEATALRYVRSRPVPFPPEPLRTAVIQLTRNRLAAADRNEGRRGIWLRTLDRMGLGFDS